MKTMVQLLQEAMQSSEILDGDGVFMQAVDSHKNFPGVQSMQKLIKTIDLFKKSGQAPDTKTLVKTATQQGINPKDIVQFCDAMEEEPDPFTGYGKDILRQTSDAFKGAA